jgi:hypothetical protein
MKALLAALLLPMILAAQTPAKNTWTVTAVAGPISSLGQKIKLSVAGDELSFTDSKAKKAIAIRGDQITQVVSSRMRFSRAQQLGGKYDQSGWLGPNMSGCGLPGCGAVILVAIIAAAVAAPMHGTSHFILLSWFDRDVEQQIQFEVGKSDAAALNFHLRELAGDRWVDVDEQQVATEKEITEHGNQAIPIELDRDSWCGAFSLPKGSYRVLVAQGTQNPTVYFFAGNVDIPHLRGILAARAAGDAGPEPFEYALGSARIASIRWQGKSLDFPER